MDNLYIDCGMGVSAKKLFGALVDITDQPEQFIRYFNDIGFKGIRLERKVTNINGVTGTRINFIEVSQSGTMYDDELNDEEEDDDDDGLFGWFSSKPDKKTQKHSAASHHTRTLDDVKEVIDDLSVGGAIRKRAANIYKTIAEATAEANGADVRDVKLHRGGSRDVIASVVGICMLMEQLKPKTVIASHIAVGTGTAQTSKGRVSIPIPALKLILDDMPYTAGSEEGEICTLDGAAVLKEFVDTFSHRNDFAVVKSGVGIGTEKFKNGINCTRVSIGQAVESAANATVTMLEAALFSDTAAAIAYVGRKLTEAGAITTYAMPISGVDGRSGVLLRCICPDGVADKAAGEIMRGTSATLVNRANTAAYQLEPAASTRSTSLGTVRVYEYTGFNSKKTIIDSHDVINAAEEHHMSVPQVYEVLQKEI